LTYQRISKSGEFANFGNCRNLAKSLTAYTCRGNTIGCKEAWLRDMAKESHVDVSEGSFEFFSRKRTFYIPCEEG
ncbi:hypothetical protein POVCU2_0046590, partial [Plasmodium ovale curtisi]